MSARKAGLAAAGVVLVLAACDFERSTVLSPLGEPSFDFPLVSVGRNVPKGTAQYAVPHNAADYPAIDTTLALTLRGLEPLTTGVYKVWIGFVDPGAPADTGWAEILGDLTVTRIDTSFSSQGDPIPDTVIIRTEASTSSFIEGGPATQIHFDVDRTTRGGSVRLNTVLVSIEASDAATEPGDVRPLWFRVNEGALTRVIIPSPDPLTPPDTTTQIIAGNVKFGNYALTSAEEYVFTSTGRGRGGVRGNVLIVDDSALARPPVGYYYATWIEQLDVDGNPIDTIMVGELTAPFPDRDISLRNADVDNVHPVVLDFPMEILAASNRIELSGATPFLNLGDVWVTLENKAAEEAQTAPTIILVGTIPSIVSTP